MVKYTEVWCPKCERLLYVMPHKTAELPTIKCARCNIEGNTKHVEYGKDKPQGAAID